MKSPAVKHLQHRKALKQKPQESYDNLPERMLSGEPHAYVHRSHISGDKRYTKDAYLEPNHGVIFFRDGLVDRGHKHYIFTRAIEAHKKGNLEAFAIHDREHGLTISRGTAETSVGVHGKKHPTGLKAVFLDVPDCCVEIHGVWEESREALDKHNIRDLVDKWLQKIRGEKKGGSKNG